MAKAYWINSTAKTVTEVEYNSVEDMRNFIGGFLTLAYRHDNEDVLYVDDLGLYKDVPYFFYFYRPDQALAGNGLLVGKEVEVEDHPNGYITLDPAMSIEQFRELVMFIIDIDELANIPE